MVCSRQMALWAASVACCVWSDRWDVTMFGALLMAVFWQQCGWLAHDFLHHQVYIYIYIRILCADCVCVCHDLTRFGYLLLALRLNTHTHKRLR